jgi:hypothetical protein
LDVSTSTQIKASKRPPQAISERNINGIEPISLEKHYSVAELAQLRRLSEKTIRKMFENEPGVITWGLGERRFKRRYRTLRIPATVVDRVHRQLRAAG